MSKPFNRKNLSLAVVLASGLLAGNNAAAQLEEVIVTAQKRQESIQDVPLSIATLSGENLQSMFF